MRTINRSIVLIGSQILDVGPFLSETEWRILVDGASESRSLWLIEDYRFDRRLIFLSIVNRLWIWDWISSAMSKSSRICCRLTLLSCLEKAKSFLKLGKSADYCFLVEGYYEDSNWDNISSSVPSFLMTFILDIFSFFSLKVLDSFSSLNSRLLDRSSSRKQRVESFPSF